MAIVNKKLPTASTTGKKTTDTSYGANAPLIQPVQIPTVKNNQNVDTSYGGNLASWFNNAKNTVGNWLNQVGQKAQTFLGKLNTSYGQNMGTGQSATGGTTATPAVAPATTYAANVPAQTAAPVKTSTPAATAQPTATSGNSTAGDNSTTVKPTMTYEQWAAEEEKRITDTRDNAHAAIETNKNNVIAQAGIDRDTAVETAETNRERAVVDARSSYEQNKATYGANAEALAAMGLSGSGYGDYINSQAYVAQRGETQAANAQAQNAKANAEKTYDKAVLDAEQIANASKLEADTSYAANMSALGEKNIAHQEALDEKAKQDEETKKNTYAALLTSANKGEYNAEQLATLGAQYGLDETQINSLKAAADAYNTDVKNKQSDEEKRGYYTELLTFANNGTYTSEQLAELGKSYGLNDAQIKSLTDAATEYKTKQQDSAYKNYLNSYDSDGFATIKTALDNGEITNAQYQSIVVQYQKSYYDSLSGSMDSDYGSIKTGDIDSAYSEGKLSEAQYNNLKTKYNSCIVNDISTGDIFKAQGESLDSDRAAVIRDTLINTGWLTEDTKSKLSSKYGSEYESDDGGCVAKGTLVMTADGSQVVVESLKEGDNVLVFNHATGDIDPAPISLIFHEGEKEHDVLRLHFDGSADIEVLYGHGFFDTDLKKYVLINADNVKEYLGHRFLRIVNEGGIYAKELVLLTDYELFKKRTEAYSVLTATHINSLANGILTVTDDGNRPANLLKGFYNLFELDDNYKYRAEEMAADIEKYGLSSYDEWKEYATEEQFNSFNGAYLKIAIGKGLVSQSEVVGYIKKFLNR